MKLFFAAPDDHGARWQIADWVAQRIPHARNLAADPTAVAIGVLTDSGRPAAGVVFNNWIPDDATIQVHLAAANPLWTRGTIVRDILAYPFFQLGCMKVWGAIPQDKAHVLKVNRKMGFKQEGVLRYHMRGRHTVITGLLKNEYIRLYWPERKRDAA